MLLREQGLSPTVPFANCWTLDKLFSLRRRHITSPAGLTEGLRDNVWFPLKVQMLPLICASILTPYIAAVTWDMALATDGESSPPFPLLLGCFPKSLIPAPSLLSRLSPYPQSSCAGNKNGTSSSSLESVLPFEVAILFSCFSLKDT